MVPHSSLLGQVISIVLRIGALLCRLIRLVLARLLSLVPDPSPVIVVIINANVNVGVQFQNPFGPDNDQDDDNNDNDQDDDSHQDEDKDDNKSYSSMTLGTEDSNFSSDSDTTGTHPSTSSSDTDSEPEIIYRPIPPGTVFRFGGYGSKGSQWSDEIRIALALVQLKFWIVALLSFRMKSADLQHFSNSTHQ